MRVSRNGRPIIIREVTKMGKDNRPKVAVDRRENLQVERVKAQVNRACTYYNCPNQIIYTDTEYARLTWRNLSHRAGGRRWPEWKAYHFGCLPPEAQSLLRFFKPIS